MGAMLFAETVLRRIRENDATLSALLLSGDAIPQDLMGIAALANYLTVNTKITSLKVATNSEDFLALLAGVVMKNTTIEDLGIESNALCDSVCIALSEAVGVNKVLRRLHLDCFVSGMLGDAGGMAIAAAVGVNSTLQALHIQGSSCMIGDPTGIAMARALMRNRSLRTLRLAGQPLGDAAGVALSAALRANQTLEHVVLAGRGIGKTADFATAMASTLRVNAILKSLAIENHHMSDTAGAALGGVLQADGALESLRVICAGIGSETVVALANGLKANSHLKELHIDGLHIREDAVVAMAAALEVNRGLLRLSLSNPCLQIGVGVEVGNALSRVLRANATIRSLKLSVEAFGEETCMRMAEGLRSNAALHELHLHGDGVGQEALSSLSTALESNVMLKHLHVGEPSVWSFLDDAWNSPEAAAVPHTHGREAALGEISARIDAALERNRMLPEYWRLLVWLTRKTVSPRALRAVAAMTEEGFRQSVFAFFLPPCPVLPRMRARNCGGP